ncbi:hypothetical protein ACFTAO_16535 [Paenibacillus rhizoplanae]
MGDHINIHTVEGGHNKYQTVTVAGIVDEDLLSKGYTQSQVITFFTTSKVYSKITGNDAYPRIFILADPDQPNQAITDYLKALVEKKDAGFNYQDRVAELTQAKKTTQ